MKNMSRDRQVRQGLRTAFQDNFALKILLVVMKKCTSARVFIGHFVKLKRNKN